MNLTTDNIIQLNTKKFDYSKTTKCNEIKKLLHDIKSPLQTLKIISKGHFDNDPRKEELTKRCLKRIIALAQTSKDDNEVQICLPNLLKSIKDQKKIEHSRLIRSEIKIIRPWLKINTSKEALENILSNLINNAVQATENSDELVIKATQCNKFTKISITDFGEGISPEQLAKIGKLNTTFSSEGSGLGLNNAIREIYNLGGEIHCRSIPKFGTQISLILPY